MKPYWMLALAIAFGATATASADSVIEPVAKRFEKSDAAEVPNFRQHVMPLLGKLGCNSRACHGSFQGQGGFRLSLFGYDAKLDHEGLAERVDKDKPENSYALQKPLLEEPHRGGKRLNKDSWEYNLLVSWIKGGAANENREEQPKLKALEVTPKEIVFSKEGQSIPLKAVAVWSDGRKEDVTCLCRFQTNDEQVAEIGKDGSVISHQAGDTHVVAFYDNSVVPVPVIRPVSDRVGDKYPAIATRTKIDELVVEKLKKLGVVPSDVSGDAEFLRRVSLDLVGTLPSAKEVTEFVADTQADKRAKKVDELLARPAYAAWWATRLSDWTGNAGVQNNNSPIPAGAYSRDWYEFIRVRLERNESYDKIAEGFVMAKSVQTGETYREYCEAITKAYYSDKTGVAERATMPYFWQRRMFQTPEDRVTGFAYSFLGIRIQCAQCHKHPFDQWTMDEFHQFKNFFVHTSGKSGTSPANRAAYNEISKEAGIDFKSNDRKKRQEQVSAALKEGKVIAFEEVYTAKATAPRVDPKRKKDDKDNTKNAQVPKSGAHIAKLLGQPDLIDLTQVDDARQPVMDWLRSKENKLFSKAFVNRVWANYFNVGIVQPPDDHNLANPPSNAALLNYLADEFINRGYDIKWLHREIVLSDTYQRTWAPNDTNKADERNFSHAVPRRMPAEVAYDAIVAATSSDEAYEGVVNNMNRRAISIAEVARNNQGGNGVDGYPLGIFGRSIRESNCDCDRSSEASLLQTVYLQNDAQVLDKIRDTKSGWVGQAGRELGLIKEKRDDGKQRNNVLAKLEAEKARGEKRLAFFKKEKDEKGLELQEKKLAEIKDEIAAEKAKVAKAEADEKASEPKDEPMPTDKLAAVVKSTYLRTLTRLPSDDELSRSMAYVQSSEDKLQGLGDLVWALINTKEFIVNH